MSHDGEYQQAASQLRARRRARDDIESGCDPSRKRGPLGSHFALVALTGSSTPASPALVVGYDGTALAREAVAQAGLMAGPTGCVFVVHAYRPPPRYFGRSSFDRRLSAAQATGRRVLEDLLNDRHRLPDACYLAELPCGPPAEAIMRIAEVRDADAIVVGARRTGGLNSILRARSYERLLAGEVPVILVPESFAPPADDGSSLGDVDSTIPPIDAWW